MSAPHSSSEKSSIWSVLNLIIGFALAGIVFLWVTAFIFKGLGSLRPELKKDPSAPPTVAASVPTGDGQVKVPGAATAAPAAPAPAAPAGPAIEITIKPDPANPLAYDTKTMVVKAGQTVKLTFNNTHPTLPQPHNFVLGKAGVDKGKMLGIAMTAMTLVDKGYIPDSPDILAHTKLIQPSQSETIEFVVPAPGEYNYICTFPGHGAIMNGVLTAE